MAMRSGLACFSRVCGSPCASTYVHRTIDSVGSFLTPFDGDGDDGDGDRDDGRFNSKFIHFLLVMMVMVMLDGHGVVGSKAG